MLFQKPPPHHTLAGQSLAEYALVCTLVLVVCTLAMTNIGTSVNKMFTNFHATFLGG